jgi:hypothetical protein
MSVRVRNRQSLESAKLLFDEIQHSDHQQSLSEAERVLLELADYVYAHTSLKPISKTLFLISRCLFVEKLAGHASTPRELCAKYQRVRAALNGACPGDDFDFRTVVEECEAHVPYVLKAVNAVCTLTKKSDSLGLAFNTLLRGKFESGEGMGTFLTPEEVVIPMVDMLLKVVGPGVLDRLTGASPDLYGDICGGTGRFVYALARRLEQLGVSRPQIQNAARLFDQSLMAVDLGKLNFLFEELEPRFERVGDSLVASQVSSLRERFVLLATNPPFGAAKYRWSKDIADVLPAELLLAIGMRGKGDGADPSELFFFRNLDLLAAGGALAIVLPDGVVQSDGFRKALEIYEHVRRTRIHVAAIVSLPAVTFSLGGTVAKTSFVIAQKDSECRNKPLYVAIASHVGFLKRGKKRADDPNGNDLSAVAREFGSQNTSVGCVVKCWRAHESLVPARLMHAHTNGQRSSEEARLCDLVRVTREFTGKPGDRAGSYHISVLDVDETGLIDVIAASRNQPLSKGMACKDGDILLSCMNPKIWRVTVVPDIPGVWSCSPEFLVLRPIRPADSWRIALALHHPAVFQSVQAMAKGTSSSRQRVPKDRVLAISVPKFEMAGAVNQYVKWRREHYLNRIREAKAYERIHGGASTFAW